MDKKSDNVSQNKSAVLCPSAQAKEGAILLGILQPDGSVAFIKDRIKVTREFLDISARGGNLETRFRFSSPCLASGCKQWLNNECSLPDRLAEILQKSNETDAPLPKCSIRTQCRWFDQRGVDVCRICPMVITRLGS